MDYLLKPPRLKVGDTIGVVAPCLPLMPELIGQYALGIKKLRKFGFNLKEGRTIKLNHWWSGGTPAQQAEDINTMFADNNVKAIIAASGGHTAISVLELLDYDSIAKNPKPFIGMSDMTCYHLAIYAKTRLVGFHMDEVCFGLGMNWQKANKLIIDQATKIYLDILTNNRPLGLLPALRERKTWKGGVAEGRLIGGNINSITRQLGTTYFPTLEEFKGAILFWEAVGLHKYDIYRMLYQLKYSGIFDQISGMLVGTITATKPIDNDYLVEPSTKEMILEVLKDYDFPVLAGMDFGHYTVNLPMPVGVNVSLDANKQTLEFIDAAVS